MEAQLTVLVDTPGKLTKLDNVTDIDEAHPERLLCIPSRRSSQRMPEILRGSLKQDAKYAGRLPSWRGGKASRHWGLNLVASSRGLPHDRECRRHAH
jgi:hypothetical protein